MIRIKKRAVALLAALVMTLTFSGVIALPAAADGWIPYSEKDSYAAQTEYAISTAADWMKLVTHDTDDDTTGTDLEGITFHFTNDVTVSGDIYPVKQGIWGVFRNCTIDGHGYTLNASVKQTLGNSELGVGLIGRAQGSTIKNLTFTGMVRGGATAGYRRSGLGGFIGMHEGGCLLLNCKLGATVWANSPSTRGVGGLIGNGTGNSASRIYNCCLLPSARVIALTGTEWFGAFAGTDDVKVFNCYNAGSLEDADGDNYLLGRGGTQITNCWDVSGTAKAVSSAGAGTNSGILEAADAANGKLAWTLNANYSNGDGNPAEKKYYTVEDGKTVFCAAENQTRKVTLHGDADTVVYRSAGTALDLNATFGAPASGTVYAITDGVADLKNGVLTVGTEDIELMRLAAYRSGRTGTDFAISTKEDWLALVNNPPSGDWTGVTFHFTNDVDMENTAMYPVKPGQDGDFEGTIDGHGYVLKNVRISGTITTAWQGIGLIGRAWNATIRNLGIASGTVTGSGYVHERNGVGAFIGTAGNACTLENCWNAASVSGTGSLKVGGLIGSTFDNGTDLATVDNCYNAGTVTSSAKVSGISGGKINLYNSFNSGNLVRGSGNLDTALLVNAEGAVAYNVWDASGVAGGVAQYQGGSENGTIVRSGVGYTAAENANGKLAYILNNGYDGVHGARPHYTVSGGKTVFGTADNQTRKVTFTVARIAYAELYTGAAGTLLTAAPSSIPGRTLGGWRDANGKAVDPATMTFTADTTLYAVFTAPSDSASASLNDTIQINLNLDLDLYAKKVKKVTVNGPDASGANGTSISKEYGVGTELTAGDDGRYMIKWPVAAAQITDAISATVTYTDNSTETILSGYSVKAYFESVKAVAQSGGKATLATVCDTALQYGACAQKAFDYKAEAPAAPIKTKLNLSLLDGADYQNVVTGTKAGAGLTRVTTSALIRDQVALRMYITLAESADISRYTFTCAKEGGEPAAITPKATADGRYSLTITGIAAVDFGKKYTFTVTKDSSSYTLATGVLNYGKKLLANTGGSVSDEMKRLVCAMKAYYCAADAYFGGSKYPVYADYSDFIKIATFNVGGMRDGEEWYKYTHGQGGSLIDYTDEFVAQITECNADIICLQELHVDSSTAYGTYGNQLATLATRCGYAHYYFDEANVVGTDRCGVGVLSRYPATSHTTVQYDTVFDRPNYNTTDHNRCYGRYTFNIKGKTLTLYNTHCTCSDPLPYEMDGQEIVQLTNAMKNDTYAVATGDFNCWAERLITYVDQSKYSVLNGGGNDPAHHFNTFGTTYPRAIDNFICSKNLRHYWSRTDDYGVMGNNVSIMDDHKLI